MKTIAEVERAMIIAALRRSCGNTHQMARELGIAYKTVYNKLARLGLKQEQHQLLLSTRRARRPLVFPSVVIEALVDLKDRPGVGACAHGWVCEQHPTEPFGHDGCSGVRERCVNPACWRHAVGEWVIPNPSTPAGEAGTPLMPSAPTNGSLAS